MATLVSAYDCEAEKNIQEFPVQTQCIYVMGKQHYSICEQHRFRQTCASAPEPMLYVHLSVRSRENFSQRSGRTTLLRNQGPMVQSIISLTSSLVVKMLTYSKNNISFTGIFAEKNVTSFCKFKSCSRFVQ